MCIGWFTFAILEASRTAATLFRRKKKKKSLSVEVKKNFSMALENFLTRSGASVKKELGKQ